MPTTPSAAAAATSLASIQEANSEVAVLPKRQNLFKILCFCSANLGLQMSSALMIFFLIPIQVTKMVGKDSDSKAALLGIVSAVTALSGIAAGIFSGALLDRVQRLRRARMMIVFITGIIWSLSIAASGFLTVPWQLPVFIFYTAVAALGNAARSCAVSLFNAMMPDFFDKSQYTLVSSLMGFTAVSTGLVSLGLVQFFWQYISNMNHLTLTCAIVCLAFTVPLMVFANEDRLAASMTPEAAVVSSPCNSVTTTADSIQDPLAGDLEKIHFGDYGSTNASPVDFEQTRVSMEAKKPGFSLAALVRPFKHKNFRWVLIYRFMSYMGTDTSKGYLLYLLQDMFKYPVQLVPGGSASLQTPEQLNGLSMTVTMLCGLVSTLVYPILGYCMSRKNAIALGSLIEVVGIFLLSYTRQVHLLLIGSVIFGFGLGGVLTHETAIINEVIPDPNEKALPIALYQQAMNIPALIASPIGGLFITAGQMLYRNGMISIPGVGYLITYTINIVFHLVAALCILRVDMMNGVQHRSELKYK